MHIRTRFASTAAAAAAAASLLATAAPVGAAQAAVVPASPGGQCTGPGMNLFVPPSVAPLSVNIGAIIIQGRLMNPPLNVSSPGISLAPICWTPLW
jgi:hypothetical protein